MHIQNIPVPVPGYVYIIGSEQFSWYKIGFSKNGNVRSEQLGILLPFKVELYGMWHSHNARGLEKYLHEKYRKNHLHGEWFLFAWEELENVIAGEHDVTCELKFPVGSMVRKRPIASSRHSSVSRKSDTGYKSRVNNAKWKTVNEWLQARGLEPTKDNIHLAWQEAVLKPQKVQKYGKLDRP